jgi:hypothetical protein
VRDQCVVDAVPDCQEHRLEQDAAVLEWQEHARFDQPCRIGACHREHALVVIDNLGSESA